MLNVFADLKFGVRMLLKRPAPTTRAVVALALGIGLTTPLY
jgi:hypothetical protein